jgi:hypothetical protein
VYLEKIVEKMNLTKQRIPTRKILRSSWNATIPSARGDAGVWKPLCQGRGAPRVAAEVEIKEEATNEKRDVIVKRNKCVKTPFERIRHMYVPNLVFP